jgi:hypothetical protein
MTIIYDSEQRRAFDDETGMVVSFSHMGHPQESERFFQIEYSGYTKEFVASYNHSERKIWDAFPNLDISEQRIMINELSELNFSIHMDFMDWPQIPQNRQQAIMDRFIELFKLAANYKNHWKTITVTTYGDTLPKSCWRELA